MNTQATSRSSWRRIGALVAVILVAAPPVRERPLWEMIGLVALFGVLAGLGLFFARTARREAAAS